MGAGVALCAVNNVRTRWICCRHQGAGRCFTGEGHRRAGFPHSRGEVIPIDIVYTGAVGYTAKHIQVRGRLGKTIAHVRHWIRVGGSPRIAGWRRRRCRRRARISDIQAIGERPRATREGRGRTGGAHLHSAGLITATIVSCPIEHVKEARTVLVEHHFKVG